MRLDYFLYMAEASGLDNLVSTRESAINATINDFVSMANRGYNINDDDIQTMIFDRHNLQDLSEKEIQRIIRKVNARI